MYSYSTPKELLVCSRIIQDRIELVSRIFTKHGHAWILLWISLPVNALLFSFLATYDRWIVWPIEFSQIAKLWTKTNYFVWKKYTKIFSQNFATIYEFNKVIRYGVGRPTCDSRQQQSFLHHDHIESQYHSSSCSVNIRGHFFGTKRPEREADHDFPSSTEINIAWSSTSHSPYVFVMMLRHRNKCSSTFTLVRRSTSYRNLHKSDNLMKVKLSLCLTSK